MHYSNSVYAGHESKTHSSRYTDRQIKMINQRNAIKLLLKVNKKKLMKKKKPRRHEPHVAFNNKLKPNKIIQKTPT